MSDSTFPRTQVRNDIDHAWRRLLLAIERLLHPEPQSCTEQAESLQDLGALLETLPLTSGEFATAHNRIRNARRYLQASEPGAARYELRLLACLLKNQLDNHPTEPRRRLRRPALE